MSHKRTNEETQHDSSRGKDKVGQNKTWKMKKIKCCQCFFAFLKNRKDEIHLFFIYLFGALNKQGMSTTKLTVRNSCADEREKKKSYYILGS